MAQVTVKTDIPQTVNYQSCTIQAGTTTTLQPGQDATVTNSGTQYNAVFDFGIPRGKNVYEQAVEGGYTGTEEEFNAMLAEDLPTVANNIEDVNTVATNISDIHTVVENVADVNTVATDISNVNTVAGISSDVSAVSAISSDVSAVSANNANITAVSENLTTISNVESNLSDVNTVAGISTDVSAVAGIASDVSAVEDIKTDVSAVASNAENITAVANNESNINAVNSNKTNIDAVAGNSTNINAVAGNEANINAVNANKTNIDTVAGNNANVTTVATNISNVNTAATNIAAIIAAPAAAANAATSEANAQTWAEGSDAAVAVLGGTKSSKGWANRAQEIAESIGAIYKPAGSITFASLPALSADVLGNVYNITDAFTTTADFVEGAGKNYPAGTNVAIVDVGTGGSPSYKFDILSGFVDLSPYRTAANQDIIDGNLSTAITNHTSNTNNPHVVTKAQVGLGNVDNTADLDKPISTAAQTALNAKQDTLVSGTNIKTVNGNSLLGSGDVATLPSQTGQSGKFLTTDGTDASWAVVDALPSQTGQNGKFLTTDGSAASWADIPTEVDNQSVTLNSNDQIQAVGVIDQNTSNANKFWTGTKAEYDAIVTKDPNTTYRTTDENETVYQNSYRIGQVLPSILPISDYGLHLLDGAVIDGTGIYSSFYTYIAGLVSTYPNLFISEADWQTAVNTYGVCGKFVYDSTNQTIRLPKITGIIEGTTDATALGDLVQAGLPNITGGMSPTGLAGVSNSYGAFYDELSNTTDYQSGTREGYGVRWGFNASRSSSIYGNSTTVQPQTIKVYYYIVIANSYQTPTGVQISRVATDLNGKVNLNSSWGMPSNTYIDISVGESGATYTAIADGYFLVNARITSAGGWFSLRRPANGYMGFQVHNPYVDAVTSGFLPVKKGDVIELYYAGISFNDFRFIYAQKDNN